MRNILFTVIAAYLMVSTSFARNVDTKLYDIKDFTIEKTKVEQLDYAASLEKGMFDFLGEIIAETDKLIAFGTKIYSILEKSKPVVEVEDFSPVNIIPRIEGEEDGAPFYKMHSWSRPEVWTYTIKYRNGFNSVVASAEVNVFFQHSGKYEGKGKYISNLKVYPGDINVGWGNKLSIRAKVEGISNIGETVEDPIATVNLMLECEMSNILKTMKKTEMFFVTGEGDITRY